MTDACALFIARREAIPHDGTRQVVADGHVERQEDAGAGPADDALMTELSAAMRAVPGERLARDAGEEAWRIHRQRRGEAS